MIIDKLKYVFLFLLCYHNIVAQQISYDSLWKERDRIPNSFIDGKITEKQALNRIAYIHTEFKKRGKISLSQEKELFESAINYLSNKPEIGIATIKKGIKNIRPKNDSLSFKYYNLAALLHKANEDYAETSTYFNKNFYLLKNNPSLETTIPEEVIAFYNNYTSFLARSGDFDLLENILFRALNLSTRLKKNDYKGIIESQIAELYVKRKDFTLAQNFIKQSIKDTKKPYYKITRLLTLGEIYIQVNEPKNLRGLLKEAKSILELSKNEEDKYHLSKLRIALLENQITESPSLLSNEIETYKKNTNNKKSSYLGNAYIQLGDLSSNKAKYYSEAVLASVAASDLTSIKAEDVIYPDIYMLANKKLAGVQDHNTATKTLENTAKIATQINKSLVFEDQKYAFEEEFRTLLNQGLLINTNPNTAFHFIELGKAKVLNDALFDKYNKHLNVKPELVKAEKDLLKKINKLRLNTNETDKKELTGLELELGILKKKIEKESPQYFKSKYEQEIVNAEQIQKGLATNAAFLNYFREHNTLYISVITKEKIALVKKALPENYLDIIKNFIKTLYKNPGLGTYKQTQSHLIYTLLFEPILPFLKDKNRITVIRDVELNLIPFEVLESKPSEYLIDKYTFSYDYSASIHYANKNNLRQYLIKNQMGIAPFADKNSILKNTFREKDLNPLPYSDEEISKISGSIFRNNEATKNRFMEDYRKHDVIHFATHAQVDDSDPSKSFIAFFPDSKDYKLFTEELYNLDLSKTQLVILSACEAGNGKLLAGEGLLSLSRGFSYAGCPAVITTLWKAHDESSAWISSRIHKYLNDGLEKAEAVRKAKIDFRNSDLGKAFDHPYYWANFILIGNDAPLQISFWNKYQWQLILGFVVLVLIAFLAYKKSKR